MRTVAGAAAGLMLLAYLIVALTTFRGRPFPWLENGAQLAASDTLFGKGSNAPWGVRGMLSISAYGPSMQGDAPLRHLSVYVNGRDYNGMKDNDLRGFLDGVFKNGWNQPGQIHVRIGRRRDSPLWGEHELLRVIQRWDGLNLPKDARVHSARLVMEVERPHHKRLQLMLYNVNQDWDPGKGGVQNDNTSPPRRGEVWWNDRGYQTAPWGLPGVGFSSDTHPQADTPATPLADAHYAPGDQTIECTSPELAAYIARQVSARQPLLFLLKMSDYLEDMSDTRLHLVSANEGDRFNDARRPRLILQWDCRREMAKLQKQIFLEYGRTYTLPRMNVAGADQFAVSFVADDGYQRPTIEMRGGIGNQVSDWKTVGLTFDGKWDWVEFRLIALKNPHLLGESFQTEFRDTWVKTAAPEKQSVRWNFLSPTGKRYKVLAEYQGDYRWRVQFTPNEMGRWRYIWRQNFLKDHAYSSAEGVFDVWAGDIENVQRRLRELSKRIRQSAADSPSQRAAFEPEFRRLVRAAMSLETPATFAADKNGFRKLLRELREQLFGHPLPNKIPLRAYKR